MFSGENHRHWKSFVNAMRSHPDEPESGQMKGYPSEWNRMDVRLAGGLCFVKVLKVLLRVRSAGPWDVS